MLNISTTTPIPSKVICYLVECKELGIFQEFSDFDTAHTFATQLAQDYPTAHIERATFTQYFDNWGDDAGGDVC